MQTKASECHFHKQPTDERKNTISETVRVIWPTEASISFLNTPAVYLSKAFNVLLAPLPHCQPPSLVEPIHNCRPPIAVCQMPASDIVHHCAGVSRANCHLFFLVLLMRRGSEKHRNTHGDEIYGQSRQPVLEIIKAYTCW